MYKHLRNYSLTLNIRKWEHAFNKKKQMWCKCGAEWMLLTKSMQDLNLAWILLKKKTVVCSSFGRYRQMMSSCRSERSDKKEKLLSFWKALYYVIVQVFFKMVTRRRRVVFLLFLLMCSCCTCIMGYSPRMFIRFERVLANSRWSSMKIICFICVPI